MRISDWSSVVCSSDLRLRMAMAGYRPIRGRHGQRLEKHAHLLWRSKPVDVFVNGVRPVRIGAFQGVRSRRQPQTGEQRRLRYRAKSPRARATGDFGERGEIDMGRQIGFPDIGKDIGIAVAFPRPQRVAHGRTFLPTVDRTGRASWWGG